MINQLLFKIQVAYLAQDYFECSGAPGNEYTGTFVNEQIDRNKIPSKFKAMAAKAIKAFDRELKARAKSAANVLSFGTAYKDKIEKGKSNFSRSFSGSIDNTKRAERGWSPKDARIRKS